MIINKTILILILLTIIPTFLFAQDTMFFTDKINNETYYVLKSDKITKHGEYKKFDYNNKLLINGFYNQGVRDSIWECYNFKGELNIKYNYTINELIYYNPTDNNINMKYKIANSDNNSDTTLSRPPIFLGGNDYITSVIVKNIIYPYEAIENLKSGKVNVKFTVDKFGKTSNYHVEQPLGFGLDEEAIRVLKLLPDYWLPGLQNGQPVDVEIDYHIIFRIK